MSIKKVDEIKFLRIFFTWNLLSKTYIEQCSWSWKINRLFFYRWNEFTKL